MKCRPRFLNSCTQAKWVEYVCGLIKMSPCISPAQSQIFRGRSNLIYSSKGKRWNNNTCCPCLLSQLHLCICSSFLIGDSQHNPMCEYSEERSIILNGLCSRKLCIGLQPQRVVRLHPLEILSDEFHAAPFHGQHAYMAAH